MEEKKMDGQKPINPNMTLDVKNAEVEQQIKNYLNDKSKENLNILINLIRNSRVLVPAAVNEKNNRFPQCLEPKKMKFTSRFLQARSSTRAVQSLRLL